MNTTEIVSVVLIGKPDEEPRVRLEFTPDLCLAITFDGVPVGRVVSVNISADIHQIPHERRIEMCVTNGAPLNLDLVDYMSACGFKVVLHDMGSLSRRGQMSSASGLVTV